MRIWRPSRGHCQAPGLDEDPRDVFDGVRDTANMPVEDEPQRVRDDLDAFPR